MEWKLMQSLNENQTQADEVSKGPITSQRTTDNSRKPKCNLFKAYNSNEIQLDNKLGKGFMLMNNMSKLTDNLIKNNKVREQKTVKCQKLTNSRAINQKWSMRFGWISNLTKIVCLLSY